MRKTLILVYILFTVVILFGFSENQPNKEGWDIGYQTNNNKKQNARSTSSAIKNKDDKKSSDDKQNEEANNKQNKKIDVVSVPEITVKPANDPAKERNDSVIVTCTIILTIVGVLGIGVGVITVLSIKKQTDFMANSERAWIDVDIENLIVPTPQEKERRIWIRPVIKNYGKTPATITKIVITWAQIEMESKWGNPGKLDDIPFYDGQHCSKIENLKLLLVPDAEFKDFGTDMETETFNAIKRKESSLYVYGFVDYLDTIEKKIYTTNFCQLYWIQGPEDPDPDKFWKGNSDVPSAYVDCT